MLTWGVTLTDLRSGEVVRLVPKITAFRREWRVQREGQVEATFRATGPLSSAFVLASPGSSDITLEKKSLLGFDVVVTRPELGQVARVRTEGWKGLEIDVEPQQDELIVVACVAMTLLNTRP